MIVLHVHNTVCFLENAPAQVLDSIDEVTSYLQDPGLNAGGARWNTADLSDEVWDGYHRFLKRPAGQWPYVPAGLRFLVAERLSQLGVPYSVRDVRTAPPPEESSIAPVPLFDYQAEAVENLVSDLDGVARMPPRAGKTRTGIEVVRRLGLPTLWIAPTVSIATQTVRAAREFLGSEVSLVTARDWEEHRDRLLTVATAGAMLKLHPEFWRTRHHLVGDEVHHYLANRAWGGAMLRRAPHVAHRKGLTGTFFRSRGDDLALLAYLSRVAYSIDSTELVRRGRLVPAYLAWVPVDGPAVRAGRRSDFWAASGVGTLGLSKHAYRCACVANVARHLQAKNRTVLVLVATKQQGREITRLLSSMYPPTPSACEFERVEFVSTSRKRPVIERILDSFRDHQEVSILVGTSMIGEGTDFPDADALVYAAGGKAAVTYVQALYRPCTAASGKEYAVIVDFIDKHHRTLMEHSRTRNVIAKMDPIFTQAVLPSIDAFEHWAQHVWVDGGSVATS